MKPAAAALLLVLLAGPVQAGDRLWETKFDRASAVASDTNHPILIEFWATWCQVCARMDREVYSDPRVAEAMRRMVPLRIDIDQQPNLARKYAIVATPTLVVTDAFGNELFRVTGSLPPERVLEMLAALPADLSRINALATTLAQRKDDVDALEAMGAELRGAGLFRSSTEYYERVLKTRDARRRPALAADTMLALGRNALDLRAYPEARKALVAVVRSYPGSEAARAAQALLEKLSAEQ